MRHLSGLFRTIFQSPEDTSTCLTIVGVHILATYFLQTRTTFVQCFIRFSGVEERQWLIALVLIGASTIVGFTLPLELSGKMEEKNSWLIGHYYYPIMNFSYMVAPRSPGFSSSFQLCRRLAMGS